MKHQHPTGSEGHSRSRYDPVGGHRGFGNSTQINSRPAIAAVLPTRNRADAILRPIHSLLASRRQDIQVIVVDQSSDGLCEQSLAPFLSDVRIQYVRSELRGLSNALNVGVAASAADLIAITGDDCEVANDWLDAIVAAFEKEPRVGVIFGSVLVGAHDPNAGFIQAYQRSGPFLARAVRDKTRLGGTSACMALRRAVFAQLHGFDPALGVGAPLRAAEETDFVIRALQAAVWVLENPRITVTHHGFMTWALLPELIERNWFGTGAAMGKLLKRAPATGALVLAGLAGRWLSPRAGVVATLGRRAHRGLRLAAFTRGLVAGLARPIDTNTGHFAP